MRPTRFALLVLAAALIPAAGMIVWYIRSRVEPLEPYPPTQIEFPDGGEQADEELDRRAVSRFAWKTFAALNWPAKPGKERGVPDPSNRFADNSGPTVWATWKTQDELYPDDGNPTGWDEHDAEPIVGVFDEKGDRRQYRVKKPEGMDHGRVKVLGSLTAVNQATLSPGGSGSPLVDQNNKVVRYETRINKTAYEFIHGKKLYRREELEKVAPGKGEFPDGSINIKAAWKELPDPATWKRYYHAEALVADKLANVGEEPPMRKCVVGLVGLHVVYKLEERHSWVWATFEHVDNVDPPAAVAASFRNSKSTAKDNSPERPPVKPGKEFPTEPVQVKRLTEIHPRTREVNAEFQGHSWLANSPWKNYHLVGVQWARSKDGNEKLVDIEPPPVKETRLPKTANVANVTMETFRQNRSCLRCHADQDDTKRFPFVFYPDFMALPRQ